jgi:hypothetical protein
MSAGFPWDVLEIPETASTRDIKRAYARLAKLYRPDQDARQFELLRSAYETAILRAAAPDVEVSATRDFAVEDVSGQAANCLDPDTTPAPAPANAAPTDEEMQRAEWLQLKQRIENRLETDAAPLETGAGEQLLLDDVCAFVRHPETFTLHVASETEDVVLRWGATHELPTSVARFIWNHYELETRVAFAGGYGLVAQFEYRQNIAEEWRGILNQVRVRPDLPIAQLFRPMRLADSFVYFTNFSVRSELRSQLHYLQQRFPDRIRALNHDTARRVQYSPANRLPRIMLEVVAAVLITVLLTAYLAGVRSGNAAELTTPLLMGLLCLGLGYTMVAAYAQRAKPPLEKFARQRSALFLSLEFASAVMTVAVFLLGQGSAWFGVALAGLSTAAYVVLVDLNGGYFQRFWSGDDAGASLAGTFFTLAVGGGIGLALFPERFTEVWVLTGVVIAGLTSIAPPVTWSAHRQEWHTRDGQSIAPKITLKAAAFAAGLIVIVLIAQTFAIGSDKALIAGIETMSGLVVLGAMTAFGWPNSPLRQAIPPMVTYGMMVAALIVFNVASKQFAWIPYTLSFLVGGLMLVRLSIIGWLCRTDAAAKSAA